jgi:hypothetical protein
MKTNFTRTQNKPADKQVRAEKRPSRKIARKYLVPNMLVDIIQSAIIEFDGKKYENLSTCPFCRGAVTGYDYKKKHFASIIEGANTRKIEVYVKRFQCRQCGRVSYAEAPFYPDTRFGKPVVDLCIALSEKMPYHRTTRVLAQMGLVIDRGTVRNYASRNFGPIPCTDIYGLKIPMSVITLSISARGG